MAIKKPTGKDLTNLGLTAYDYTQKTKAYNDLMERQKDIQKGTINASNNASNLINSAYGTASQASKDKFLALQKLLSNNNGKLDNITKDQASEVAKYLAKNRDYQSSNIDGNLNFQNKNDTALLNRLNQNNDADLNFQNRNDGALFDQLNENNTLNKNALDSYANREFEKKQNLYTQNLADTTSLANKNSTASRDDLNGNYGTAINAFNPYTKAGSVGLLNRFLTGDPSTRVADYVKTPGYDFRYNEGMDAIDKSASARGTLLGGAAVKEAMKYGQGMAQQGYDNYIQNLQTASNMGLNATGTQSGLRQNLANSLVDVNNKNYNSQIGAKNNFTNQQSGNLADIYGTLSNNQNSFASNKQGALQNVYDSYGQNRQDYSNAYKQNTQNAYDSYGQNRQDYSNAYGQNQATYNQGMIGRAADMADNNRTTANANLGTLNSIYGDRYSDLANIAMGKNTTLANLGVSTQGALNDMISKMAGMQYANTRDTTGEKNILSSLDSTANNVFGNNQGALGNIFGTLFNKNVQNTGTYGPQNAQSNVGGLFNSIGDWFN